MKHVIAAVLLTILPAGAAYSASFHQINGLSFPPEFMSDDASVIVGTYGNTAYRWEAGIQTSLSITSWAGGVSGDGRVMVGQANLMGGYRAFSNVNGNTTNLGLLPGQPDTARSSASDASFNGSIIVGSSGDQAVRWENGVIQGLGFLPGATSSYADIVSRNGDIIAGRSGGKGFCWANNIMTPIEILPNYDRISVEAISDFEGIIGSCTTSDWERREAFYWQEGSTIGLGDLPGGNFLSAAFDISSDGSIIIGSGHTDDGFRAFIWDESNGMRDLKEVIEKDYSLDLSGWELQSAICITPDGQKILGNGIGPDGYGYWIAEIPEPATISFLSLGGLFLRKMRRKR